MVGVEGRSGGKRPGAGRKYKFYPHIKIDYCPYASKDSLLRALDDLYKWILEDRIDTRRAATGAHILEVMAKIQIPSLIEEKIEELGAEAERTRKALADRIAAEVEKARSREPEGTASIGLNSVNYKDKDSEG